MLPFNEVAKIALEAGKAVNEVSSLTTEIRGEYPDLFKKSGNLETQSPKNDNCFERLRGTETYNPYDSSDPYYDGIDSEDVANLPDPYEGFEKIESPSAVRSEYPSTFEKIENVKFSDIEKKVTNYIEDLKIKSECPETISDTPFKASDLEKISPEEVARGREEFDTMKSDLKKQWEQENARQWPKYENDVYSSNGKLIRQAGSDYDAHHIQPLGMGGKNEVSNITPLHAEVHYDRQGVHVAGSPYSDLNKILGGV